MTEQWVPWLLDVDAIEQVRYSAMDTVLASGHRADEYIGKL